MGDLDYYMSEEWVTSLYLSLGFRVLCRVIRDRMTQQVAGYGFVEFSTQEDARRALESLPGQSIPNAPGRSFRLNWATYGLAERDPSEHSIFVGDLAPEVNDAMLLSTFAARYPSVKSVRVFTDSFNRSKGYGHVRMASEEEARRAVAEMHGTILCGRAIRVTGQPGGGPADDPSSNTLVFVGNVNDTVFEEEIRQVFGQFGEISLVRMPPGRGFCFVGFASHSHAERAILSMNGSMVFAARNGNLPLRVNWGRSLNSPAAAAAAMANGQQRRMAAAASSWGGMYGGGAPAAAPAASYGMPMTPNPSYGSAPMWSSSGGMAGGGYPTASWPSPAPSASWNPPPAAAMAAPPPPLPVAALPPFLPLAAADGVMTAAPVAEMNSLFMSESSSVRSWKGTGLPAWRLMNPDLFDGLQRDGVCDAASRK